MIEHPKIIHNIRKNSNKRHLNTFWTNSQFIKLSRPGNTFKFKGHLWPISRNLCLKVKEESASSSKRRTLIFSGQAENYSPFQSAAFQASGFASTDLSSLIFSPLMDSKLDLTEMPAEFQLFLFAKCNGN